MLTIHSLTARTVLGLHDNAQAFAETPIGKALEEAKYWGCGFSSDAEPQVPALDEASALAAVGRRFAGEAPSLASGASAQSSRAASAYIPVPIQDIPRWQDAVRKPIEALSENQQDLSELSFLRRKGYATIADLVRATPYQIASALGLPYVSQLPRRLHIYELLAALHPELRPAMKLDPETLLPVQLPIEVDLNEHPELREIFDQRVENFPLTIRLRNGLRNSGYERLGDVVTKFKKSKKEIGEMKNVGLKSANELEAVVHTYGGHFSMRLKGWS